MHGRSYTFRELKEFWPWLGETDDTEAFKALWPNILEQGHTGILAEDMNLFWAYQEHGALAVEGMLEWLQENVGERGTDWEEHILLMGFRDADAAFWFKMRWM